MCLPKKFGQCCGPNAYPVTVANLIEIWGENFNLPLLIPEFCSQAPLDTCKVTHYFKYIRRTDFFSLLKYSVIVPKSRSEVIMQSP
jgi:hypothetical protein